jgi:hypothetical protein
MILTEDTGLHFTQAQKEYLKSLGLDLPKPAYRKFFFETVQGDDNL